MPNINAITIDTSEIITNEIHEKIDAILTDIQQAILDAADIPPYIAHLAAHDVLSIFLKEHQDTCEEGMKDIGLLEQSGGTH